MRTRAPGTVTSPEFALGPAAHHSPGVHAALSVLEALIVAESLSLSELATQLGIPKSSLLRVCSVLTHRGWVTRARDGRYSLGVRAIGLSAHATEYPLVRAFRAVAPELLTRHNETVCLAVLDGDESTFIALEETSHPVRLVTNIGDRTAAFASPSGQVILADRARQVVAAEYAGRSLVTPTGRRLRGVEELLEILEGVRRNGWAENNDETALGLYTIAVPIRNAASGVLAALTMCVPTARMNTPRREQILSDLADAGRRLSEGVAWLPAWNATRAEPSRVRAARSPLPGES